MAGNWELFLEPRAGGGGGARTLAGLLPVCFCQLEEPPRRILTVVSKPRPLSRQGVLLDQPLAAETFGLLFMPC